MRLHLYITSFSVSVPSFGTPHARSLTPAAGVLPHLSLADALALCLSSFAAAEDVLDVAGRADVVALAGLARRSPCLSRLTLSAFVRPA